MGKKDTEKNWDPDYAHKLCFSIFQNLEIRVIEYASGS